MVIFHFTPPKEDPVYKRRLPIVLGLLLLLSVPTCFAQSVQLNIPRDSQRASVTQRIGVTDITVNYHRPLVKGRTIWGKVVPYGQVWRAGANENTIIQFTDPVTVEGKAIEAGEYGLHMIPGEDQWIVIFSKASTAWGNAPAHDPPIRQANHRPRPDSAAVDGRSCRSTR